MNHQLVKQCLDVLAELNEEELGLVLEELLNEGDSAEGCSEDEEEDYALSESSFLPLFSKSSSGQITALKQEQKQSPQELTEISQLTTSTTSLPRTQTSLDQH